MKSLKSPRKTRRMSMNLIIQRQSLLFKRCSCLINSNFSGVILQYVLSSKYGNSGNSKTHISMHCSISTRTGICTISATTTVRELLLVGELHENIHLSLGTMLKTSRNTEKYLRSLENVLWQDLGIFSSWWIRSQQKSGPLLPYQKIIKLLLKCNQESIDISKERLGFLVLANLYEPRSNGKIQ